MAAQSVTDRAPIILIVDDTPANLSLLANMLRKAGYSARPARSGRLALRSARADPPDLVLLDITMPEMDGYEVCRALKADPKLAAIPVVFLSALGETEAKVKALAAGGVDYVTKPFQVDEILARVRNHIDLSHARAELELKNEHLKQTQSKLVHAEKMSSLGVLAAGIAHEINNPLNAVRASAKALPAVVSALLEAVEAGQSPDALAEDVEALQELSANIVDGASRSARIIEGLRLFSRQDQGAMHPVDVNENLDATLSLVRHRVCDGLRIERRFGELPMVFALPGQLNQVFLNLISNALDAAESAGREGGTVTVSTETSEESGTQSVVVRVEDTGRGIPEAVQSRIFDPFFTTKDVGRGTGLGLSISHEVVADHGGTLEVEKTSDSGTVFRVTLPVSGEARA